MGDYRRANRDNWDDRVPIHVASDLYDVEGFLADPDRLSTVVEFDREILGDVTGKRLVHLQCHFGKDTLSWARLGAQVTGVDFSEAALAAARDLAARAGLDARFVLSELYDAPAAVGERFDVVYTGVGALNWLPDIRGWAEVVAALLVPEGTLYLRESHPVLWGLDWREDDDSLVIRFPYFETAEPVSWDDGCTYAGDGTVARTRTYEWNHGIGEIFNALTGAGLRITHYEEYRHLEWKGVPHMEEDEQGRWWLPPAQRDLVPLSYSLMAVK